jgi:hypothetical protein
MGIMVSQETHECVGACSLIAHNLVFVARHTIEGCNVRNIHVTFGYVERPDGNCCENEITQLNGVVDGSIELDYAVVLIKAPVGATHGYMPLETEDEVLTEPALLHYPLGKPLKVSVHGFKIHQIGYLSVYHDSGFSSSGGGYISPSGKLAALHLGTQLRGGDEMNFERLAYSLKFIAETYPKCILSQFVKQYLSQNCSYQTPKHVKYTLECSKHNFCVAEEGTKSAKLLKQLLEHHNIFDIDLGKTKQGYSTSVENLDIIESRYPVVYRKLLDECVAKEVTHGQTNLYSPFLQCERMMVRSTPSVPICPNSPPSPPPGIRWRIGRYSWDNCARIGTDFGVGRSRKHGNIRILLSIVYWRRRKHILLSTVPTSLSHFEASREAVNQAQHVMRGRGVSVHFKEPPSGIPLVETDVVVVDLESQAGAGGGLGVFVHGPLGQASLKIPWQRNIRILLSQEASFLANPLATKHPYPIVF